MPERVNSDVNFREALFAVEVFDAVQRKQHGNRQKTRGFQPMMAFERANPVETRVITLGNTS